MRKRHVVLLAGLLCAAGVVAYQAVTHREPEPFVRREEPGTLPEGPYSEVVCIGGGLYSVYTTVDGENLPPADLERPCPKGD